MSTTQTLIATLKAELKAAGMTHAGLARELGMAESFRWRPHGPVMECFRKNAVQDYFNGGLTAKARC